MFFASDNTGPVHPDVMDALLRANEGYAAPYGTDEATAAMTARVREVFEAPDAAVHLVPLGTAANALLLATMMPPWGTTFCTDVAHIHEDECNAPEFYTGGGKLSLVPSEGGKMTPDALRARIEAEGNRGVHGAARGPVSITQVTEKGSVYTLDELRGLTSVAREFGLQTHLDGARFTNALVALDRTPAEMTWKAGIDAVSFGGTKNGLMAVEAAILFDPAKSLEFEYRRKRGAQLFSKHRFLSAQMNAYLTDDLWLEMARAANAKGQRLRDEIVAAGAVLAAPAQANMIFASWPRAGHRRLQQAGAAYSIADGQDPINGPDDTPILARLVTNWATTDADIDQFIAVLKG